MPRSLRLAPLATLLLLCSCVRAVEPSSSASLADRIQAAFGQLDDADDAGEDLAEVATRGGRREDERPVTADAHVGADAAAPTDAGAHAAQAAAPAPAGDDTLARLDAAAFADRGAPTPAPAVEIGPGSVKLGAKATVYAEPDATTPALGLVAAGTRVGVVERVIAPGCPQAWLGIAPAGYVCAPFEDTELAPSDTLMPRLSEGRRIPGTFGRVAEGTMVYPNLVAARTGVGGHTPAASLTVRRQRRVQTGGRSFWKTNHGYIPTDKIRRFSGSRFAGIELAEADAPSLPLGWAKPAAMLAKVAVHAEPSAKAKVLRKLTRREIVELGDASEDGRFVALRDGGWVARGEIAVARAGARPEGTGDDERWMDIDLEQQTLVAYIGDTAVFTTMISSGRPGHSTPTGVFRVSRKHAQRTMNSMADSKDKYSVASVPWTAYFATGYALHAAYWHDNFGHRKSHGCVNLAPLDARRLYDWMAPLAAPGWTEVYGHEDQLGSVVRIKSARDPEPAAKGYAANLLDGADDGSDDEAVAVAQASERT